MNQKINFQQAAPFLILLVVFILGLFLLTNIGVIDPPTLQFNLDFTHNPALGREVVTAAQLAEISSARWQAMGLAYSKPQVLDVSTARWQFWLPVGSFLTLLR